VIEGKEEPLYKRLSVFALSTVLYFNNSFLVKNEKGLKCRISFLVKYIHEIRNKIR